MGALPPMRARASRRSGRPGLLLLLAPLDAAAPLLIATMAAATPAWADSARAISDDFAPLESMGLPIRRAPYVGIAMVDGKLEDGDYFRAQGFVGYRRDLVLPALGVLGVGAEGYGAEAGDRGVYGARAFVSVRALRLKTGLDFSSRERGGEFILTLEDPILRGGFPLRGATTRFEWIPARGHLGLGLTVPIFQPWIGRTRPRTIRVELSDLPAGDVASPLSARAPTGSGGADPLPDSLVERAFEVLSESARWIDFLTTPHDPDQLKTNTEWLRFIERVRTKLGETNADHPDGRSLPQETSFYHERLLRIFSGALGDSAGDGAASATCSAARRIALDQLITPYNANFGRLRDDKIFDALARRARAGFAAWCDTAGLVPPEARERALRIYARWLCVLESVQREAHARWDDTRKIWLPYDLVLLPGEHDSQAEIDALLESLLGSGFERGNQYEYLVNEAFSPALIRSLHDARDYHVLWIHDFPGRDPDGDVDSIGCEVVTAGYLDALAGAVRRLDETGRLPLYMVLLDQWYFDGRKGHWWMRILDDPLGESCRLPKAARAERERVFECQARLRAAVDSSATLRRLTAERGRKWLRKFLRVHVNVTFPGDPTFAGRTAAPVFVLKFSDDYMRDHSKLVLWDVSEEDPARGAALLTGEGVGENYEGSRWEDRTLLLRGPGALVLKSRVRELLESQGFTAERIPPPLRARAKGPDWEARVDSLVAAGNGTRVLLATNGTGYQTKGASALKAALYNLMPPGSRVIAPDSQWSSYYWAGMLAGAALRGLKVFVVAARPENAPYGDAPVQNVLTHDVLEGYVQLRQAFSESFSASGGSIGIGVYGQEIGTRSLVNRYRSVVAGIQGERFPRDAFPFAKATYAALGDTARLVRLMGPLRTLPPQPESDHRHHPKLHLKSQFFASGPGLEHALGAANWDSSFALYVARRVTATLRDPREAGAGMMSPALLAPIRRELDARGDAGESDVFYLLIGSHNQNDRSLLLDGEVLCLLAGPEALAPIIDFAAIAARSYWVETTEELDRIMPRHTRTQVKLARKLRALF